MGQNTHRRWNIIGFILWALAGLYVVGLLVGLLNVFLPGVPVLLLVLLFVGLLCMGPVSTSSDDDNSKERGEPW